ncbi:hypothetical protein HYR99_39255 [Candidatus Poribacteria bacterium]|nr:hypothetical protein [Candidatus Poribacteria bacterium]
MRQPVVWISVSIVMGLILIIIMAFVNMPQTPVKTFPADNGPSFIDVSGYPPQMQEAYKVFAQKCSRCHTLARPINSKFFGEEWRQYVYKMMRKPGSGLTPKKADEIIEFLIYDSQVRKR